MDLRFETPVVESRLTIQPVELVIFSDLRACIVDHLRRNLPFEGVGLLAMQEADRVGAVRAMAYYPGENADVSPIRYTMRRCDVASALRDMDRRGFRLGAVVHSHPRTPPVPSATDLAEAIGPEILSVIVGFTPVATLRAWQLAGVHGSSDPGYREVRITDS
ncbi:MAG: M67 family metallopeptidase [Thermomicrobiales bacterium]